MFKAFDPEIEWIEPPEFPGGGTTGGHAVVAANLSRARESWAEETCDPKRFIGAGDNVVVSDYVRVRLKGETEWREGPLAAVYTFSDGKVFQVRVFADRQHAQERAGVKVPLDVSGRTRNPSPGRTYLDRCALLQLKYA